MNNFLKIELNKLESIFANYRHIDKSEIIDNLYDDLVKASTPEVSTYSEEEFNNEKRRYLTAKAMGRISKTELKILGEMTRLAKLDN